MSKNVLFVTEGSRAEPRFLDVIRRLYGEEFYSDYSIFPYNTNLHRFIEQCFEGEDVIEEIDTISVLRACRTNADKSVLDRKFTDIFLVFDMDPHDSLFDMERLSRLAEVLCESTDAGKLYINYPMMESLKHIPDLDSFGYLGTRADESIVRDYKRIVGMEGDRRLRDLGKLDRSVFDRIVWLNLLKADIVLGGDGSVPDGDRYSSSFNLAKIGRLQTEMWKREKSVWILNTSVFCLVDYRPQAFLSGLIEKFGDGRQSADVRRRV